MDGPEFFQTPAGATFFSKQLPRFISALERIADALEGKAAPSVSVIDTAEPEAERPESGTVKAPDPASDTTCPACGGVGHGASKHHVCQNCLGSGIRMRS